MDHRWERQTGRTTRMVIDAIDGAGFLSHALIWCYSYDEAIYIRNLMEKLLSEKGIRFERPHKLEIICLGTRYDFKPVGTQENWMSYGNCTQLVDHHVYENYHLHPNGQWESLTYEQNIKRLEGNWSDYLEEKKNEGDGDD